MKNFKMHKLLVYKPGHFLYFAYGSNMFTFRIRMLNHSAEFITIGRIDNYRVEFITYSRFWGGPLPTLVPTANAYVWGVIWRLNEDDMITLDTVRIPTVDYYGYHKTVEIATYPSNFLQNKNGTEFAAMSMSIGIVVDNIPRISDHLDKGIQVVILYVDFQKAFDRVDNDVLLVKLCDIGFSPKLLRFFASYVRDRQRTHNTQVGVDVDKYYALYVNAHTPHMGSVMCRTHIQTRNPLPRGDRDQIPVERWPSWALREIMVYGALEHGLPEYYINALKALKHNGEEGAIRAMVLFNVYAQNPPCTCPPMNYKSKSEYILDVDELRGTKGFHKNKNYYYSK